VPLRANRATQPVGDGQPTRHRTFLVRRTRPEFPTNSSLFEGAASDLRQSLICSPFQLLHRPPGFPFFQPGRAFHHTTAGRMIDQSSGKGMPLGAPQLRHRSHRIPQPGPIGTVGAVDEVSKDGLTELPAVWRSGSTEAWNKTAARIRRLHEDHFSGFHACSRKSASLSAAGTVC